MTVEAALVLPLFIFASACLLLPMKILTTERRVQAGLESVCEELSLYAYLADVLSGEAGELADGTDESDRSLGLALASGGGLAYAADEIGDYLDTEMAQGVTVLNSSVLADAETIRLVVNYEIRLPFPVLNLSALSRTAVACRRAWIGAQGTEDGGEDAAEETEQYVYVGKNSTRYHLSSSCHYLSNNLEAVLFEEVSQRRNSSGSRYTACSVCGSAAGEGSTVYIMPSGTSYHASSACSAINAYVRRVALSEVAHLGACSYCGK